MGLGQLKREITATVNGIFGPLNGNIEDRRGWGFMYGTLFRMGVYLPVRTQTMEEVRAGIEWEREGRLELSAQWTSQL